MNGEVSRKYISHVNENGTPSGRGKDTCKGPFAKCNWCSWDAVRYFKDTTITSPSYHIISQSHAIGQSFCTNERVNERTTSTKKPIQGKGKSGWTDLSNERQHVASDIPLREAGTGICEEVLPFPHESLELARIPQRRERLRNDILLDVGPQPAVPRAEGSRVICMGGSMGRCCVLRDVEMRGAYVLHGSRRLPT